MTDVEHEEARKRNKSWRSHQLKVTGWKLSLYYFFLSINALQWFIGLHQATPLPLYFNLPKVRVILPPALFSMLSHPYNLFHKVLHMFIITMAAFAVLKVPVIRTTHLGALSYRIYQWIKILTFHWHTSRVHYMYKRY